MPVEKNTEVMKIIGARIKRMRITTGYTTQSFARELGVSHQQITKYEKAVDRVSVDKLYEMSLILEIDPCYFFSDLETKELDHMGFFMVKFVENFSKLDRKQQEPIAELVKALLRDSE